MGLAQLIVHESGRRWIDHIRSRMAAAVRVRHSTTVPESLRLLRGERETLLVVELGQQPLAALELIEQANAADSEVTVLVLADSSQRGLELSARELGAVEFIVEPITPGEVADIVERAALSMLASPAPQRMMRPAAAALI